MIPVPGDARPDLDWIAPGFAIGSRPYAAQRAGVARLGIRAVVALHEDPDDDAAPAWRALGVRLVALPTSDWVAIPPARFDDVVAAVGACLDAAEPVLLHCYAGINRAPTFAAAVLCARTGLPVNAALRVVRDARPAAAPTPAQATSLHHWARVRLREGGG